MLQRFGTDLSGSRSTRFSPPPWRSRVAAIIACVGAVWTLLALATASDARAQVCARVKIEIVQELTLERQAFDAKMKITNGLQNLSIEDIGVEVLFEDPEGNPVEASSDPNSTTASFFITLDSIDGVSSVDGNGTIAPESAGEIHWLIIPAPGAAGPSADGTLYFVGAKVTYSIGGDVREVEVVPDSIYVKPMPMLYLDYFLPEQVHSDNPYTPAQEPPVPFTLGVRVANNGFGAARNLKINSSQPKIVENELGLLIAFEIIGSEVNGSAATPSLLVDFGTIDPDTAGIARWFMTSTLQGKFIEFSATFSHADELGGTLTSLLEEVNTHTLVHDVLVNVTGSDTLRDFLADDPDGFRVYESDNVDTEVFDASSSASVADAGGGVLRISVDPFAGFGYLSVSDPLSGSKLINQVVRSDGRVLHPANAWLSKVWVKSSQSYLYYLNIFDENNTGPWSYDFTFGGANVGNLAPELAGTPDRNVRVGETLTYNVTATDANGDALTMQAAPLPVGATFQDLGNGAGVLSWTPGTSAIGQYPVDFAAYDGALFDTATAIIGVVPADATNEAPTATSAALHANKNEMSDPVTPTVVDADVDDKHFFAIVSAPTNGEAMVTNNQLVYLPDTDYVGLDSFQYEAMDLFGETVTGTAQVTVIDGDNLIATGLSLIEGGGVVTAVEVGIDNVGSIATLVPTTVELAAHTCSSITQLGTATQTFGSGPGSVVFPVDLSAFGDAPIVLVATIDAGLVLPEANEFDNRASRGLALGAASPLSVTIESSGAAPETICDAQVLTATGRSYFSISTASETCIGPYLGAATVQYELEDLNAGTVVRSGAVISDGNGAWHVEFGLPTNPGASYELRTFATDGERLNLMTRSFATSTCAPAIPPPMVPAPPYPGPGGDVPVIRFNDGVAKYPWTVHPGLALPAPGLDGSGAFGHTRGTGSNGLAANNGPAIGTTGGVAQQVQEVDGEQVIVSTFNASVDAADLVFTPSAIQQGQTVTMRGLVSMNDSFYGLPVRWNVTESGGSSVSLAPPTWYYANGDLMVVATWTPRTTGDFNIELEVGPDLDDTDDTDDRDGTDVTVAPDANANLPELTALDPNQGLVGTSFAVSLTGVNFTSDATFDCGAGVTVSDVVVTLDDATFGTVATATFSVAPGATSGLRTCVVTTTNGSGSLVDAFSVLETLCDNVVCDAPPTVCHEAIGTCDLADGSCDYAPRAAGSACDDGVDCTTGAECDGAGVCGVASNKACNDGIPCTIDTCDSQSGCLNIPAGQDCDPAACLMGGDLNGSGSLNVADALCAVLVSTWMFDTQQPLPGCVAGPTSLADMNCSGSINVADVQFMILIILGIELNPAIDRNADMCHDQCNGLACDASACDPVEESCLVCGAECGPCSGTCCGAHATAGCSDTVVQECVCDDKPECCSVTGGWDASCAQYAVDHCGLTCN